MQANPGYAAGQMAKAFATALTHESAETRERAEKRLERWRRVLSGMASGSLSIGSRTPVKGLPAWVTPEVVKGGFATGTAAASGPVLPYEQDAARRAGVACDRRSLFLHYLTDEGLNELYALLDSGEYDVVLPEEGALLTVAWLLRAGDRTGALEVLEAIGPFADRLRFSPRPGIPLGDASLVHRQTVGQVRARIEAKPKNKAVAAMNEALVVWNPFADELLEHWLETVEDGRVFAVLPDGWGERGAELLARYRRLARNHILCGKHRNPKENLAILRSSLESLFAGKGVPGLLQHAVDSMVAKRGLPGSPEHAALRARQASDGARPAHHTVAQIVLARLADAREDSGVPSIDPFIAPITEDESRRTGVTAGAVLPDWLCDIVKNALRAPVPTLIERGIVPSAEVLAELTPQLVAATTASAYPDPALRRLMAAQYTAFRNRRTLLLLNLESQVRMEELPWVRAVRHYRRTDGTGEREAHAVLVQLGELALQGFPGTALPNPLLSELGALAKRAGLRVPFVEELAADIFMGTFSTKYLRAAQLAADVLEGTLYERYYGIDYAAVRALQGGQRTSDAFDALCRDRAGDLAGRSWVAANGKVIEQAQILTTHNLAALVHPVGVSPSPGWDDLARRAFATACRLVRQVHGNPRPLGTVKDAAYAWRQAVFFLALCGLKEQVSAIAWMQDELDRQPPHTRARLDPVLAGLRHVLAGGSLDDGTAPTARRFTGWATGRHWLLATH
ncbi:transcriptional regulator [Actinomadura sp. NPDC048394]|uniref:transcriptional regulator n=1 Tax=Actinomadura sp. NPDC048394 TaxID=3158223 RepID=UPI0033D18C5E